MIALLPWRLCVKYIEETEEGNFFSSQRNAMVREADRWR